MMYLLLIPPTYHKISLRAELFESFKLLWPSSLSCTLLYMLQVVIFIFGGRLGDRPFAELSLGISFYNVNMFFMQGACTALLTYTTQAFGRGDTRAVKVWFQRSLVILTLFCIPMCLILFSSEVVFGNLFGTNQELSAAAAGVCIRLIPGVPFMVWFFCIYLCDILLYIVIHKI